MFLVFSKIYIAIFILNYIKVSAFLTELTEAIYADQII